VRGSTRGGLFDREERSGSRRVWQGSKANRPSRGKRLESGRSTRFLVGEEGEASRGTRRTKDGSVSGGRKERCIRGTALSLHEGKNDGSVPCRQAKLRRTTTPGSTKSILRRRQLCQARFPLPLTSSTAIHLEPLLASFHRHSSLVLPAKRPPTAQPDPGSTVDAPAPCHHPPLDPPPHLITTAVPAARQRPNERYRHRATSKLPFPSGRTTPSLSLRSTECLPFALQQWPAPELGKAR
jgi:hypothetical protein